ncbi:hypothetical protein SAMN04490243_1146 [Robiginitalea myxolifaciens]|uniref:Uncharacterized protein n=1 Tax=Robiginitalea myxolifaciens TaxID=400055 RepID=A0A1I6G2V0_9FLAO|nr:hypothetical protein [Robiginitalea myxolifaciens]SFR36516.1 hypothetical protein SAMN04490243_1146 [Robiginitalea myxolifaciens]
MKSAEQITFQWEATLKGIRAFVMRYAHKAIFWTMFLSYLVVLFAFLYKVATEFPFY